MKLQPNAKLLLIGDSITDAGRLQPVGEGLSDPYGRGYVNFVNALVQAAYPQLSVRMVNMGLSGNTVRDLKARWQRDVLGLKPDWLSIMIGINDVWRHFDLPLQPEIQISEAEYEQTLDDLITAVKPALAGLILITPYFIEPNKNDPMRKMMDAFGRIVAALAKKHGALLVDTQAAFDRALSHTHPMNIAGDRVHPNQHGHMVIARAFLDAIGFAW